MIMTQQTAPMPVGEFIRRVLNEIYDVCDAELHPTIPEFRAQSITSLTSMMRGRAPAWFLDEFLETAKSPRKTVERAIRTFREAAHPFNLATTPSKSLRECILTGAVPQVARALVTEIFGPIITVDPSTPPQLKFTNEVTGLYTFLVQRTAEDAIGMDGKDDQPRTNQTRKNSEDEDTANSDGTHDDDNGEIRVTLTSDDVKLLVQNCSEAIFSVNLLIKKLRQTQRAEPDGQYL